MISILTKLVILALSVYVAAYIIPGVIIDSFVSLIVVSIVIGAVNTFIKPVLVILTFPLTVLTLGIFLLLLNGVLIMLVGFIVPGFEVTSFLSAVLFSIVVSLISSLLTSFK